jgi:RimJ/RimL family protein N-acetyltransferase
MNSYRHILKDSQTLYIREARACDAARQLEFLDRMCGETDFISFGPGEFDLSVDEEAEFIEKCLTKDNQLFIVAEIDETIVGSLCFVGGSRPRSQHTGEFGVSVLRDYWGLGIGGLLMDTLICWARKLGVVTKINLRVCTENLRAIALYEKKGFVVEGTVSRDLRVNGVYRDHYFMGLKL